MKTRFKANLDRDVGGEIVGLLTFPVCSVCDQELQLRDERTRVALICPQHGEIEKLEKRVFLNLLEFAQEKAADSFGLKDRRNPTTIVAPTDSNKMN